MIELPIVVEASTWPQYLFGAACLAASLVLIQGARWSDDIKGIAGGGIGALATGALGIALLVQHLGWQLQVDQKGIALSAPFDPMHPGGQVAWADMTAVEVVDRPYRGPSYFLRVRGRDGAEIMVAVADKLPRQFGVALQTVVAERAPQVTEVGNLVGQLDAARQNSDSVFSATYSARDGRGNALR